MFTGVLLGVNFYVWFCFCLKVQGNFPSPIVFHFVKSVRIRIYSGPHFRALRLNTERYGVSPYSIRLRENADQNDSVLFFIIINLFRVDI